MTPSRYIWLSLVLISLVFPITPRSVSAQTPATPALKTLSLEDLMNVEVTSVSKRPERLFETASAIQVITREDIRRSGAESIPEALRLASNLEVAQIDARQWAISARGFNNTTSNKLLVMIDGRTVYTPLYAGVFWDVQDILLEDVDRIEVISGPGATVWGANAVNGVINIITRKAKDTQGTLLSGGGGTEVRGCCGVRYGGKVGPNVPYRVYGKYFARDRSVLANGQDGHDSWHTAQFGFREEWTASRVDVVTLQGDLYDGRASQPIASEIGLGGGNLMSVWEHTFSDASDLKLQFYYDRTNRRVPSSFAEGLDTYDIDLQHRIPLAERHDVVWGVGYRLIEDNIVNPASFAFLPPHVSRQLFSAFVQDEVALVKDRLHFTFGTKIEDNDYTGFELQPSGRVVWQMSSQQSLWGAVSRAVRTPSRIDREFFAPRNPPFILFGSPNFGSEDLLAYELGYRGQLQKSLSVSVATFFNHYDNLRTVERINPLLTLPVFLGNGGKGEAHGAEFAAEYRPLESWRVRAAYSPLKLHFAGKPASTDPNPGASESHDPNHQFSLRSLVDLPAHFEFDNTFRYVSSIDNQSVPAYGELDSRLGWRPSTAMEISILGENLLHPHHAEFGAPLGRHEIQRGVRIKVLWAF
jgi:iron complex outermembrane receptor protein